MLIRSYKPSDREAVENIHFETGCLGKGMSDILTHRKEYSKGISYYLDKEPESIFLAEEKGKVVGYLFGCLDDKKHGDSKKFLFRLILTLFKLPFMNKKDRRYWLSIIKRLIKTFLGKSGELNLKHPKNAGHIHINILEGYRKKGIGTKLLKKFFQYAKSKRVKIIHADSFEMTSKPKRKFWTKNGFKEYSKVKSLYWHNYLPNEEIYVVCYVKKL